MFGKKAKSKGKLKNVPDDYELCGTCGYDHEYDAINQKCVKDMQDAHQGDESFEVNRR